MASRRAVGRKTPPPLHGRCGLVFSVALAAVVTLARGEPGRPAVTALGKLQPADGVVRVAVPYSMQGPSLVGRLLVEAGQTVTNGQVLAHTHTHGTAAATAQQAERDVEVRRARLAVVESGLKPAEVAVLAAEAQREQADFTEAGQLWRRAQQSLRDGTISTQEYEAAQARWLAGSNRVLAAEQRLAAGAEVRAVDVALARAEVASAEAALLRARRELEQTEVRAPFAGEVLAVQARAGEIAAGGLLDLGRTDVMEVKAEVYESDIRHLMPGQRAEVSGEAFAGTLPARVTEIGRQVRPNRLLHADPAAFTDNRVIELTLLLDDPKPVAGLTGALVRVRFLP